MNNFKDLSKSLPEKTQTFEIDVVAETTKIRYYGEFEFTIPNLRTAASISKNEAALNGGLDAILDYGTKNLHHMISYLKFTITKAPKFWEESNSGYDLMDGDVIEAVYMKTLEIENAWIKACWGEKEEEKTEEIPKK